MNSKHTPRILMSGKSNGQIQIHNITRKIDVLWPQLSKTINYREIEQLPFTPERNERFSDIKQ